MTNRLSFLWKLLVNVAAVWLLVAGDTGITQFHCAD
jgi:hypothetical protein